MKTERLLTQTRVHLERQTREDRPPLLRIVACGTYLEVCLAAVEEHNDYPEAWPGGLLRNAMRELADLGSTPDTIGGMAELFAEAVACADMCVMLVERANAKVGA